MYTSSIEPSYWQYYGTPGERLRVDARNLDCPDNCPLFKITIRQGTEARGPIVASGISRIDTVLPSTSLGATYSIIVEPELWTFGSLGFTLRLSNY